MCPHCSTSHQWTPTPILSGKTPLEVITRKPTRYDYLHIFGSLCYAHRLPRSTDKFNEWARRCIFVGYPYGKKGWKLFDLELKIFISRDVIFHEDVFHFQLDDTSKADEAGRFQVKGHEGFEPEHAAQSPINQGMRPLIDLSSLSSDHSSSRELPQADQYPQDLGWCTSSTGPEDIIADLDQEKPDEQNGDFPNNTDQSLPDSDQTGNENSVRTRDRPQWERRILSHLHDYVLLPNRMTLSPPLILIQQNPLVWFIPLGSISLTKFFQSHI